MRTGPCFERSQTTVERSMPKGPGGGGAGGSTAGVQGGLGGRGYGGALWGEGRATSW